MENKNPVFSKRISAGTRVYYLDVNTDGRQRPYLSISEITTDKAPKKKRQRVFIHSENLMEFATALEEVSKFIKDELKE